MSCNQPVKLAPRVKVSLLLMGLTLGSGLVGCGAMRGEGPDEDAAFAAITIDQTSAQSTAISVLELLRLASDKSLPQNSPRETAFLKAITPLVDEAALTAELETLRSGKSINRAPAANLLSGVLRQWPLLVAFYRDGLQVDQAIEQTAVPPKGVTTDTMAIFVPAMKDDSSIWLGFKCVWREGGWQVYHLELYTKPPSPPITIDVAPAQ